MAMKMARLMRLKGDVCVSLQTRLGDVASCRDIFSSTPGSYDLTFQGEEGLSLIVTVLATPRKLYKGFNFSSLPILDV